MTLRWPTQSRSSRIPPYASPRWAGQLHPSFVRRLPDAVCVTYDEISSVTPPNPASPVSYTYDANGIVTNRGSDTFAWDYENRLTSTTIGGTTTSFTYPGDGLRASQTSGSTTTSYTWDLNSSLPVV